MSRYSVHPMEQHFTEWTEKKNANRMSYWDALRRADNEYKQLVNQAMEEYNLGGFYYFLQNNYGFRPDVIDGKYAGTYTVTEPKKFMLFQLQYWQ